MRLLARFEHKKAAEEFISFQPTLFFGVPTIYVRLLDTPIEPGNVLSGWFWLSGRLRTGQPTKSGWIKKLLPNW